MRVQEIIVANHAVAEPESRKGEFDRQGMGAAAGVYRRGNR